jgi:hypothetical protein
LPYKIKETRGRGVYEVLDRKTRRDKTHVHGRPRCKKEDNVEFNLNEEDESMWT